MTRLLQTHTIGDLVIEVKIIDNAKGWDADLSPQLDHISQLIEAAHVVIERSGQRGQVWRRSGVKGASFQLMAKAERAFSEVMAGRRPDPDNYIDAINYAAFALRLMADGEAKGCWPWEGS